MSAGWGKDKGCINFQVISPISHGFMADCGKRPLKVMAPMPFPHPQRDRCCSGDRVAYRAMTQQCGSRRSRAHSHILNRRVLIILHADDQGFQLLLSELVRHLGETLLISRFKVMHTCLARGCTVHPSHRLPPTNADPPPAPHECCARECAARKASSGNPEEMMHRSSIWVLLRPFGPMPALSSHLYVSPNCSTRVP